LCFTLTLLLRRNPAPLPEKEFRRLGIYEKGDKAQVDSCLPNIHTGRYDRMQLPGRMTASKEFRSDETLC